MSKKTKFSFGTDPEMMLVDKDGNYKSAIGVVPGSKEDRHTIGSYSFYQDNVLAEFTVPPMNSIDDVPKVIGEALATYSKLVHPLQLVCQASQDYPASELTDPKAMEIGCSAEFCAYEVRQAEPPLKKMQESGLRSAGGHIHAGTTVARDNINCLSIIRMMDLFIGIPSVLIDKDPTTKARKELYGKAGRFRQPPHGAEYRSIGNFWLSSPRLAQLMYALTEYSVDFVESKRHETLWEIDRKKLEDPKSYKDPEFTRASCHKCVGYDLVSVRKAIDTMDVALAVEQMKLLSKLLPKGMFCEIERLADRKKPFNMYDEWFLKSKAA